MVWSVSLWASTRQKPEYVVGTAMRVTHLFLGAIVAYMVGFLSLQCSLCLVPELLWWSKDLD